MAPDEKKRRPVWPIWLALAISGAGVLAHVAFLIAGSPPAFDALINDWVYNGSLVFAAATCLLRAAIFPRLRSAWAWFGVGLLFWASADIYWVVELGDLRRVPYPSVADAGYLAAMPCFFVGVAQLSRQRIGHFTAASWVDAMTASLATAAIGVALLSPALVGLTQGRPAAVMVNLAYPLADLILIAFIAGAIVVSGIRGSGAFLMIGAGLLLWTGADAIYLYLEATSSYTVGWLDTLWTAGALLVALSAVFSVRHRTKARSDYRSPLWSPALIAGACAGLLVWDHFSRAHEAAVWLAGAALLGVGVRLALSFRESDRLIEAARAEAITDTLTGLGNRRLLLADLSAALSRRDTRYHLAFFDLDGFKTYNDSFGHPAGDGLLRRLGGRLAESVGTHGTAYRLGGDEFCVLAPMPDSVEDAVEIARDALTARGEGFRVSASCGHARLPEEADTTSEALRLVDQRMYAEKGRRSTRVAHQTQELLLRILREREPLLNEHAESVTRRSLEMARALTSDAEQLDVIRRAAQLHDIGKIAIPEEILNKPGSLDANEWDLMRRHTLVGERILGSAPALRPVATVVRSSHERWDGGGYPDGLAGEEIPLGARVVFVCDAFDAMTSERTYQPCLSEEEAIAELRRHAGTQFDPELVSLFIRLWEENGPKPAVAEPAAAI